jgi:ribosomal protein S18 acetylase RimI-like enzyme
MNIRDASIEDAPIIADFNRAMALETGDPPLDDETIAAGVANILEDRAKGQYWVAVAGHEVVGQICVTYEWSDWRNGTQWWIQSVYVHPDYRRQGLFTALYRHVESLARKGGDVCGLRLYVRADNEHAKSTYASLGMTDTGYVVMADKF